MSEQPPTPKRRRVTADGVSTVLEVVGALVAAGGFALLALWLGLVVLGAGLIGIGFLLGSPPRSDGGGA